MSGAEKLPTFDKYQQQRSATYMKDILIFLGGTIFGSTVAFIVFCLLAGIRLKNDTRNTTDKEEKTDV